MWRSMYTVEVFMETTSSYKLIIEFADTLQTFTNMSISIVPKISL